jgi:prefoldin subunit 5
MGFLGFGKRDKVLDLTEGYKRQVEKDEQAKKLQQTQAASSDGPFSFFDSSAATQSSDSMNLNESPEERKKRLAKRIMEMTEKVEDLSNQIYHLQQRVEVLERKANIRTNQD